MRPKQRVLEAIAASLPGGAVTFDAKTSPLVEVRPADAARPPLASRAARGVTLRALRT